MWLLAGGFIVHLILLCAIFDIYFRTPIVTGITPEQNPVSGPAKRVVLFIADGLRADSLYPSYPNNTPYIREIIEKHGTWGVSHTRVPTESRPGIVAIVAGIYEDPSAVFKGWKEYPVEFDTVLNQSRHTWAWGSPDVIHMFTKGHVETFSVEAQDFSSSESWQLDLSVFRSVKQLFTQEKKIAHLENLLNQDQIIFFLHLVGLDTAGHTVKPTSKSYVENLKVVDAGVKETVALIESFYNNDGKTAYVFTADHGMTDWGSHGAGSTEETEVPIVAWGAGVHKPRRTEVLKNHSPNRWRLGHLMRADVAEADIAVLMAALIGCNIPVNSVLAALQSISPDMNCLSLGDLLHCCQHFLRKEGQQKPTALQFYSLYWKAVTFVISQGWLPIPYLDIPSKNVSSLAFYNARQLMNQAKRKRELLHSGSLSWLYKPFPELTPEHEEMFTANLQGFMNMGDFNAVAWNSKQLADLSIRALRYYHNYHQGTLLLATSLAFLSWIAWLLHAIYVLPRFSTGVKTHRSRPWKSHYTSVPFGAVAFIVFVLIQAQGLPWQFNVYGLLPVLLLWALFRQGSMWLPVLLGSSAWRFLVTLIFVVAFSMVMVSAFFNRWMLSLWLMATAFWPLLSGRLRSAVTANLKLTWMFSAVVLAIFPLLPVVGGEPSTIQVLLSGLMWLTVGTVIGPLLDRSRFLNTMQLLTLFIAVGNAIGVTSCRALGFGLPYICQLTSWIVSGTSLVLPLLSEGTIPSRLLSLMLGLVAPYMLLSVKYEGLFLITLGAHLVLWLLIEAHTSESCTKEIQTVSFPPPSRKENSRKAFSQEDFRRAVFFVFYIFLSFFGTGNIASLNSFDVTWVRCFISVFSPFTMTALILFKILVPFIIVTCVFRAISTIVNAPMGNSFLAVLVLCDLMGLQFLHLVTNDGSWLDIGTSISHYVIVQVTVLFLVIIYGLASVLTGLQLSFSRAKTKKTHHPKGTEPFLSHGSNKRMTRGLLPS